MLNKAIARVISKSRAKWRAVKRFCLGHLSDAAQSDLMNSERAVKKGEKNPVEEQRISRANTKFIGVNKMSFK